MNKKVVIGSRESKLAVLQSQMVKDYIVCRHPQMDVEILTMKTTGDKILDRTLDKIGGKGLFVKELDRALLEGRSQLSVHSLKDMPMEVPEKLPILAFSKREDVRDVLVLPKGCDVLDPLKPIGCSSLRRKLQLKEIYPDMQVKSIRGNLQTRLEKLDSGEYSALVLAAAGLKRLGLENRISRYFDTEEMIPAAGQGILAQLLQQKGAVVAVTGDGTNDAPALNHAQVGLSMGTGTSVAKEASDITLLDDSFNSIGTAVMWGRSLYKNIQRFIVFQLTINFVALLIVLLGSMIGTELPLTVTQMLWVNLIMDTFAALALASIPPSETVMQEKPRRSTDFIISKAMRNNILGVGTIFLAVLLGMIYYFDHSAQGMDVHNLTIFFTFFVMLQFWNLFNARVFGTTDSAFKGLSKSYGMELIVLAILVGQFLIVQFGGAVFRTEPLDWQTWLLIIGVSSTVLWVGELIRLVQRSIHK